MNPLLILLTALLLSTTACDTLPRVTWPEVVQCGSTAADDLFPAVNTILLDDSGPEMSLRAKSGLEDMARKHGPEVVSCLVDRIVSRWTNPMATQTPERTDSIKRARGWQKETGVEVRQ